MTDFDFAARLVAVCKQKTLTLGTAESCTGGGVAEAITAVAGSSSAFTGGFVTYTNELKMALLGVSSEVIDTETEVSHACAKAMAEGARKRLGTTYALSTTGYAGPGGGTKEKPVGLVYISVASPETTVVTKNLFTGNREEVRLQTVAKALSLLTNEIRKG